MATDVANLLGSAKNSLTYLSYSKKESFTFSDSLKV